MAENEKKQTTLRLDAALYEKIEKLGKQENRKVGPQIEYILKKYFELKES